MKEQRGVPRPADHLGQATSGAAAHENGGRDLDEPGGHIEGGDGMGDAKAEEELGLAVGEALFQLFPRVGGHAQRECLCAAPHHSQHHGALASLAGRWIDTSTLSGKGRATVSPHWMAPESRRPDAAPSTRWRKLVELSSSHSGVPGRASQPRPDAALRSMADMVGKAGNIFFLLFFVLRFLPGSRPVSSLASSMGIKVPVMARTRSKGITRHDDIENQDVEVTARGKKQPPSILP
ncbi:hypothetical protein Taro_036234 [Colocasia esculenta]|uniref:Uncharacterized protein n=1 Tax=Colocasia esculenta TaxID=4460 RepID=A0A843WFR4_COLES|nr:hypothetical protein [Colocasia esculenta]